MGCMLWSLSKTKKHLVKVNFFARKISILYIYTMYGWYWEHFYEHSFFGYDVYTLLLKTSRTTKKGWLDSNWQAVWNQATNRPPQTCFFIIILKKSSFIKWMKVLGSCMKGFSSSSTIPWIDHKGIVRLLVTLSVVGLKTASEADVAKTSTQIENNLKNNCF